MTPPALKPFWKVFNMDAGHFDAQTAYAAVNTMRLDDMRPHLFRTHDGGKSWTEIDNGIPDGAATSAIREDPKRKGLLYAGSETQVYVSFDDGDHWQSLRLNMPASSVRDLEVKGDDLIAATHGRGYLILDDVTPLRQIAAATASESAHLYAPQTALRIRNDMNPPTPWPADFPSTKNPPDGAVIDYYLGANVSGVVTLEIADSKGQTIARFNTNDPVPKPDPRYPDPPVWERKPRVLSAAPGHHRFLWDMQYPQVPGLSTGPDDELATPHDTPQVSTAPWVMPGEYTVRLIANGKTLSEPLKVVMDPRVKTPMADLEAAIHDGEEDVRRRDEGDGGTARDQRAARAVEGAKWTAGGGAGGSDDRFEAGCDCGAGAWWARIWAWAGGTGNAGFSANATGATVCTRFNPRMKRRRQRRAGPSGLRRCRWMG